MKGISGGAGKTAIVGMKQRKGEVRAKVMNEVTKDAVMDYVRKNIAEGTTIFTDRAGYTSTNLTTIWNYTTGIK